MAHTLSKNSSALLLFLIGKAITEFTHKLAIALYGYLLFLLSFPVGPWLMVLDEHLYIVFLLLLIC